MRDLLTKDASWKILSVALAIAIWLIVQAIRNEAVIGTNPLGTMMTRTFDNQPVLAVSASADVRELKVRPNTVQVTVSGRPEIVVALKEKEIHATVDLTGIESTQSLRKRIDVSAPIGVTLLHVLPADVEVVVPPKRSE